LIVVTNRGPARFTRSPDGGFTAKRGAGGIVGVLGPRLSSGSETPIQWVATAMNDDDRAALAAGEARLPGVDLHLLDLGARQQRLHYDVVSNSTLWFLHHGLFDLPRRPRFDHHFREAWGAYVDVNRAVAERVADVAADGDVALVHDYQLSLVPGMLSDLRPDLGVVHFTHTPFCGPNSIRVLPDDAARAICESMARVACGFHTQRWAAAFESSSAVVLGEDRPRSSVFVSPFAADAEDLRANLASEAAVRAGDDLDALVGDRRLILRSDRIDPSKNIVRGFLAFDRLLHRHEEWRERVVFIAMLNPSREALPEYQAYRQEVEQAAAAVNDRWGRPGWTPIELDLRDDFPRSVAGFARYDVLLVNPIKDGLNLVAKEGPILNERDGVVCLSPEAGAFDELGSAVVSVHPYDLEQNADALHRALSMPGAERGDAARRLRELATGRTPAMWLDDLVAAAGQPRH
jgi:trehalose 6-phosphate synthase